MAASLIGRAALDDMVKRRLGPALRAEGFRGTRPTWRLTNTLGDVAVLNVQASSYGTKTDSAFVVNLSVVPEPLWAWSRSAEQRPVLPSVDVGVPLRRLAAQVAGGGRSERWWRVTDEVSAAACGDELLQQVEDVALPSLRSLLDRPSLLAAVREQRYPGTPRLAYLCLLADEGPSDEFDEERERVLAWTTSTNRQATAAALSLWLQRRIAR